MGGGWVVERDFSVKLELQAEQYGHYPYNNYQHFARFYKVITEHRHMHTHTHTELLSTRISGLYGPLKILASAESLLARVFASLTSSSSPSTSSSTPSPPTENVCPPHSVKRQ